MKTAHNVTNVFLAKSVFKIVIRFFWFRYITNSLQLREKHLLFESENYSGNALNTSKYISLVSAVIETNAFWIFVSPKISIFRSL